MAAPTTLPTPDELDAAERRLTDAVLDVVVEGSVENLASRVFKVINLDEYPVTYEHIGALAVFANDLRNRAQYLRELAGKFETAALVDLEGMRLEDGRQGSLPSFDEHGSPTSVGGFVTPAAAKRYFAEGVQS